MFDFVDSSQTTGKNSHFFKKSIIKLLFFTINDSNYNRQDFRARKSCPLIVLMNQPITRAKRHSTGSR